MDTQDAKVHEHISGTLCSLYALRCAVIGLKSYVQSFLMDCPHQNAILLLLWHLI